MQGFILFHASSDVMDYKALIGHQLRVYTTLATIIVQNKFLRYWAWIMLIAISIMVRFACSAIPFCWSLYKVDVCFSILWSFKKCWSPLKMYSPLLSNWISSILCFDYVSIRVLNSLNFLNTSFLDFNIYTHIFLIKSSMKVIKYLAPLMDMVLIEPHTFECIISKGFVVCLLPLGKPILCCLSSIQPS